MVPLGKHNTTFQILEVKLLSNAGAFVVLRCINIKKSQKSQTGVTQSMPNLSDPYLSV